MPANLYVYLLGLAVGGSLLSLGGLLGYWLGKRAIPTSPVDREQFLSFLRNLASWTNEYAGDVSRYQTQLAEIDKKFRVTETVVPHEIVQTLRDIMDANRQLQSRLDSAEQKLDIQTHQISNVLVEARTDGLTGLVNRKAFDQALDGLFGQWTRYGRSYSMAMLDIDHFKQINDIYGHPAGDAVLRQVSHILQLELGQEVCLARYGGEEFSLLSTASAVELAAAIDRVRQLVSQTEFEHESVKISVTLSAGAAEVNGTEKIGNLVRRADQALYASKTGGRNRVHRHDATQSILVTAQLDQGTEPLATHTPQELGDALQGASDTSACEAVGSDHIASLAQDRAQLATAKVAQRLQRIVEEESQRLIQR